MASHHPGVFAAWPDAYLLGGARTPFIDLNGALSSVGGTSAAR